MQRCRARCHRRPSRRVAARGRAGGPGRCPTASSLQHQQAGPVGLCRRPRPRRSRRSRSAPWNSPCTSDHRRCRFGRRREPWSVADVAHRTGSVGSSGADRCSDVGCVQRGDHLVVEVVVDPLVDEQLVRDGTPRTPRAAPRATAAGQARPSSCDSCRHDRRSRRPGLVRCRLRIAKLPPPVRLVSGSRRSACPRAERTRLRGSCSAPARGSHGCPWRGCASSGRLMRRIS